MLYIWKIIDLVDEKDKFNEIKEEWHGYKFADGEESMAQIIMK